MTVERRNRFHRTRASKQVLIVLGVIAAATSAAIATAVATGRPGKAVAERAVYTLANRCFAMRSGATRAGVFYLKPTGLGTYLLYTPGQKLLSVKAGGTRVGRALTAGRLTEWRIEPGAGGSTFSISSTANRKRLMVAAGGATLTLAPAGAGATTPETGFRFQPTSGCKRFPEAELDAVGPTFKGTNRDGTLFGFVDAHVHITGNMRSGGDVISGEAFDRFGIPTALGQDAKIHGHNGSLDLTGNLLRNGSPVGTHDTHGWPTFAGWPTYNSMTHQQVYYVWLQRAWEAGLRLVVAQTADDEPLCRLEPRRLTGCDETRSIKAQITRLKQLQDYVDAQAGGPGRGFFRIVYSPSQARRVIEGGKLAVILGIESSDLLGCSEVGGRAQCTRGDIDRGLREYRRLGVRGMFVAHWINNAFAGAALEGGTKGVFINILNRFQTGSYFRTGPCPGAGQGVEVHSLSQSVLQLLATFFPAAKSLAAEGMPAYPSGVQCNSRGLTALGRYLISRLMAQHMLIEVDHLSERARDSVLSIAERAHYPLVSSHNGTGGEWTPSELIRLYRLGGFAAVTPDVAPTLAAKILRMSQFKARGKFFGVGIGTDTNGFSALPGPRSDAAAHPLHYPFTSYDGKVTFARERTGTRTFDLNTDGVAHYGLIADLLADMQRTGAGRRALALLFRSAEAYLETWERAVQHHVVGVPAANAALLTIPARPG